MSLMFDCSPSSLGRQHASTLRPQTAAQDCSPVPQKRRCVEHVTMVWANVGTQTTNVGTCLRTLSCSDPDVPRTWALKRPNLTKFTDLTWCKTAPLKVQVLKSELQNTEMPTPTSRVWERRQDTRQVFLWFGVLARQASMPVVQSCVDH